MKPSAAWMVSASFWEGRVHHDLPHRVLGVPQWLALALALALPLTAPASSHCQVAQPWPVPPRPASTSSVSHPLTSPLASLPAPDAQCDLSSPAHRHLSLDAWKFCDFYGFLRFSFRFCTWRHMHSLKDVDTYFYFCRCSYFVSWVKEIEAITRGLVTISNMFRTYIVVEVNVSLVE